MLMNGSGIIGRLNNMPEFFQRMKRILRPGGCIFMDSSDLRYLFEEEDGSIVIDLAGDYYGDWIFDRDLRVGDRIVFEDMIHYTMVKTTMFNGVAHPAIAIVRRDGAIEIIREFGYEDFKSRMS